MLDRYLGRSNLHRRLQRQGHSFWAMSPQATDSTDVSPPPDIRVTVAVEPDSILNPEYRNRYFAFRAEYVDEPLLPCDVHFPLPEAFKMAAEHDLAVGDLMAGPVRWLLHRLARFLRIIVWPMSTNLTYTADGWLHEIFGQVSELRQLHPQACPAGEGAGAILLDQKNPADAQILWSVANYVSHTGDLALTVLFFRKFEVAVGIVFAACAIICCAQPVGILVALVFGWMKASAPQAHNSAVFLILNGKI
jgi:hypothetical protein